MLDIVCSVARTVGVATVCNGADDAIVGLGVLENVVGSAVAFVRGAVGLTVRLGVLPGFVGNQPSHRLLWICWITELTSVQFVML